jgi:hypothetical protein
MDIIQILSTFITTILGSTWLTIAAITFISSILNITWSVPFIFGRIIGWYLYVINDVEEIRFIQNNVTIFSSIIQNNKPSGLIIGYNFVGILNEPSILHGTSLTLLCNKKFYEKTIKNQNQNQNYSKLDKKEIIKEPYRIKIREKGGSYEYIRYYTRWLNISDIIPRINQSKIIHDIIDLYNQKNHVVSYVYGNAGCGKSFLSVILANQMKGEFTRSFNPTTPGDTLSNLYNSSLPSKINPLIILIDEIDIIINNILTNNIRKHKSISTEVTDKNTWNTLFDNIDYGLYPNIIIIMTSNIPPKYFDEKDESILRLGRIDTRYLLE